MHFLQENALKNIARDMSAILSRSQCDNLYCNSFLVAGEVGGVEIGGKWTTPTTGTEKSQSGIRDVVKTEVTRWRHQMKTFSASLAICAGNSPVTGEFLGLLCCFP